MIQVSLEWLYAIIAAISLTRRAATRAVVRFVSRSGLYSTISAPPVLRKAATGE